MRGATALLLAGCLHREQTAGAGPGLVLVPREEGPPLAQPAVALETRRVSMPEELLSPVLRASLLVQDFEAISGVYRWYFEGTPEQDLARGVIFLPGLVMAPLAGSEITSGWGLRLKPKDETLSVEAGLQSSVWLRPSDPELRFDVTAGAWAALNLDVDERWGVGLRSSAEIPLVHRAVLGLDGNIVGATLTVYMRDLPRPRGEELGEDEGEEREEPEE